MDEQTKRIMYYDSEEKQFIVVTIESEHENPTIPEDNSGNSEDTRNTARHALA